MAIVFGTICFTFSFPFLRIVKNKLNKMQKNGNLRVFDCDDRSYSN